MITKRGLVVLLIALLSYVAVPVLEIPSYLQITGILLALLALCFVWCWLSAFGIRCNLECDGEARVGGMTYPRLIFFNQGLLPNCGITVRLSFPPAGDSGRFVWAWLPILRPLSEQRLELELVCRQRGRFTVGGVSLFHRDPLGLFCHERHYHETAEITVLPAHVRLDGFPFIEAGAGFRDPQKTIPTPGYSNEFYAIRPYLHGDSPRWIHWLSSARRQELMTRQYQAPIQRRVLIVLDCCRPRLGLGKAERFELTVAAAASIIYYAADTDHEVGFFELGRQDTVGDLGAGAEPMRRALSQLAATKRDGKGDPAAMEALFRSNVQSLVFVSAAPSPLLQDTILRLRSRGRSVSAVLAGNGAPWLRPHLAVAEQLQRQGVPTCRLRDLQSLKEDLEKPIGGGLAPLQEDAVLALNRGQR